jgi:uncharacterized protein
MTIEAEAELRHLYDPAMELALAKQMSKIDRHARAFIEKSPFLCIATSNADGRADISPRGDPAGFVQVVGETTLVIPDRPGNNRLDTMVNIVENPNVSAIFFIPGINDTLRVVGKARIVRDEAWLVNAAIKGRVPKVAIVIEVEEVFFHCAKALVRSHLWDASRFTKRGALPSLGRIILDQTSPTGVCESDAKVAEADEFIEDDYKTGLY